MHADGLNSMRHGNTRLAAMNQKFLCGLDVLARRMKSGFNFWRQAAFDFDRPKRAARQFKQQINLLSGGGSIEIGRRPVRRAGDQRLDDKVRGLSCAAIS